jgi:two-component system OmpR family response regulator
MSTPILIIEDNVKLAQNIASYLETEQFTANLAHTGDDGLTKAQTGEYAAIILDLNLPGKDGLEICRTLRATSHTVPILMLTARTGNQHIITGLDTGADDYLAKPFDLQVLLARLRALLRREAPHKSTLWELGDVTVNTSNHEVHKSGTLISLAPREYALLEYLLHNQGVAQDRTTILDEVWGEEPDLLFSQTVDVHVAYLRKKLGKDIIRTVPGTGYLIPDPS